MATELQISTVEARRGITELLKAARELGRMFGTVDGVLEKFRKSTRGSAETIDAQIKSLDRAGIQFKSMRTSLKEVGASTIHLANLGRAAKNLGRALVDPAVSSKKATAAISNWEAALKRSSRAVSEASAKNFVLARSQRFAASRTLDMGRAAAASRLSQLKAAAAIGLFARGLDLHSSKSEKATKKTKAFNVWMRNLGSSAVFAVGPLSGIGARISAFTAVVGRANLKIALFAITSAGLVIGLVKLVKASINAVREMQKITNALIAAEGSAIIAAKRFEFLSKISADLGLNLPSVAQQFAQLSAAAQGTSLQGEGVRKIFSAVSKASVALSLSTEQTTGAFRALQQMISKGTVQSEELKGQFGERIPGAMNIAAVAMRKTTKELQRMLEQGEVLAEDLLPKLARELEKRFASAAKIASSGLEASLNKLSTAVFNFNLEFARVTNSSGLFTDAVNFAKDIVVSLTGNIKNAGAAAAGLATALTIIASRSIIFGLTRLLTVMTGLSLVAGILPGKFLKLGKVLKAVATLGGLSLATAAGIAVFDALSAGASQAQIGLEDLTKQMQAWIFMNKGLEKVNKDSGQVLMESSKNIVAAQEKELAGLKKQLGEELKLLDKKRKAFAAAEIASEIASASAGTVSEIQRTQRAPIVAANEIAEQKKVVESLTKEVNIATTASEKFAKVWKSFLDIMNDPNIGSFGEGLSKAAENALAKIRRLIEKDKGVKSFLESGRIDSGALAEFTSKSKAFAILQKVPQKDLVEFRIDLEERLKKEIGGMTDLAFAEDAFGAEKAGEKIRDVLADSLGEFVAQAKKSKDAASELQKQIKLFEKGEIQAGLILQGMRMKELTSASLDGEEAVKKLKRQWKIDDDDKAFIKNITRIGLVLKRNKTDIDAIIDSYRELAKAGRDAGEVLAQMQRLKPLENKAEDLTARFRSADLVSRRAGSGLTFENILAGEAFENASKALKGLSSEDAPALLKSLERLGFAVKRTEDPIGDAVSAWAGYGLELDKAEIKQKKIRKQFELFNKGDIQKDLTQQIARTALETEDANKGPRAFKALQEFFKNQDLVTTFTRKIEKIRIPLEEAGFSADKMIESFKEGLGPRSEAIKNMRRMESVMQEVVDGFTSGFQDVGESILDAFAKGEAGAINFKEVVSDMLLGLSKEVFRFGATNPLSNIFRAASGQDPLPTFGNIGGIGNLLGSLFGGGKAAGGPVGAGRSYLVGEKGPEIFAPSSAGTIIPNGAGGGDVVINQHYNFQGATLEAVALLNNAAARIKRETLNEVSRRRSRGIGR